METLARLVVNVVDLAETEGRSLRRSLVHFFITLGLSATTALLTLFGLIFVLWGVFGLLRRAVGGDVAALILGVVGLGLGIVSAKLVKGRAV
jgi:hypothetical protein